VGSSSLLRPGGSPRSFAVRYARHLDQKIPSASPNVAALNRGHIIYVIVKSMDLPQTETGARQYSLATITRARTVALRDAEFRRITSRRIRLIRNYATIYRTG